ncbi:hypothetical protein [Streptomyces massasporeus]|uniref:hypothetical protein n=1 Tax=Streptomyces massasporeus TaxID=67324 RepID=UPI0036F50304
MYELRQGTEQSGRQRIIDVHLVPPDVVMEVAIGVTCDAAARRRHPTRHPRRTDTDTHTDTDVALAPLFG